MFTVNQGGRPPHWNFLTLSFCFFPAFLKRNTYYCAGRGLAWSWTRWPTEPKKSTSARWCRTCATTDCVWTPPEASTVRATVDTCTMLTPINASVRAALYWANGEVFCKTLNICRTFLIFCFRRQRMSANSSSVQGHLSVRQHSRFVWVSVSRRVQARVDRQRVCG